MIHVFAACVLASSGAPYDFTHFEEVLWPQWVSTFKSGAGAGDYSWLPNQSRVAGEGTSIYGTTDLVYASFAVGRLNDLTPSELAEWGATINSFQNKTTGWYVDGHMKQDKTGF
jgi:hypothetical protein